jgi:hypothetical protein
MNLDDRHLIQQESFCVQQMLSNVIFVQYNMVKTFDHLVHHTWAKQMYFSKMEQKNGSLYYSISINCVSLVFIHLNFHCWEEYNIYNLWIV